MSLLDLAESADRDALREAAMAYMNAVTAFPAPLVAAREVADDPQVGPALVPASARRLAAGAVAAGWSVRTTHALGYVPDPRWRPTQVAVREPVVGEDGVPEMTKPAKTRTSSKPFVPQPKMREVPTGELVLVTSIAVRCHRDGRGLVALWWNGSFEGAWASHPLRRLGIAEARAALA